MEVRQKEVEELQSQAQVLSQEGKDTDEVDGQRRIVEKKFQQLLDPLRKRKGNLMASREIHQFNRDMEDEIVSTLIQRSRVCVSVCVGVRMCVSEKEIMYARLCKC